MPSSSATVRRVSDRLYTELDGASCAICEDRPLNVQVVPGETEMPKENLVGECSGEGGFGGVASGSGSGSGGSKGGKGGDKNHNQNADAYATRYAAAFGGGRNAMHTRSTCNWDATPAKRQKDLMKKFTTQEMEKDDLSTYLADTDSDEEDDGVGVGVGKTNSVAANRALLLGSAGVGSSSKSKSKDSDSDS